MSKGQPCLDCGQLNKRGGDFCSTCYMRRYRLDETHRRKGIESVSRWNRLNPAKRRRYRRKMRVWAAALEDILG